MAVGAFLFLAWWVFHFLDFHLQNLQPWQSMQYKLQAWCRGIGRLAFSIEVCADRTTVTTFALVWTEES